jgi:predicted nucleic acid-binding protein/ribosomal protein S18 acetylase RimI-like enzyme
MISGMVTIEPIVDSSAHLSSVKRLWRLNSDKLGYFPDGAFDEYASKGRILIARQGDAFQGYLLYRTGKTKATIVHLCVASAARGNGYPEALLEHLVSLTSHLRGVDLRCRRDFAACKVWQRLGFTALKESVGRATNGSELTHFWLDFNRPDLFKQEPRAARVILDANVFLDLVDRRHEESQGLLADWLHDSIELFVTSELNNDIHRAADPALRQKRKLDALCFQELKHSHADFQKFHTLIRPLFPDAKTEQDESDVRHLARAVAANAAAFLTRDDNLLRMAEEVYNACGLRVLRPAELIGQIDEVLRENEYQRFQVAGTRRIHRQRVSASDDSLIQAVAGPNERHSQLRKSLNSFFADPQRFNCTCIADIDGTTLAVYVIEDADRFLHVPFFRIGRQRLGGTLARCILTDLTRRASREGKSGVLLCDPKPSESLLSACIDLGFLQAANGYLKVSIAGTWSKKDLAGMLQGVNVGSIAMDAVRAGLASDLSAACASDIEHLLWPAKIVDAGLPAYLVPIRPEFAEHLFDEHLANEGVFGADIDLALNPESVYYRSACQRNVKAPGRLLWYVSGHKRYRGTKSIRACSRIAEVQVGPAKRLFRQFQRLGVYEWADVLATANGDANAEIMAIRFHDTELLRPITWDAFQLILRKHGVRTNLESPVTISSEVFSEVYALAFA